MTKPELRIVDSEKDCKVLRDQLKEAKRILEFTMVKYDLNPMLEKRINKLLEKIG